MPKGNTEQSHVQGLHNAENRLRDSALGGDILWSLTPLTVVTLPTSSAWSRTATATLVNAAGEVHTWFNGVYTTGWAVNNTSAAGTATIPSQVMTIVAGVCSVTSSGDAEDWLDTETDIIIAYGPASDGPFSTFFSTAISTETFTA